MARSSEDGERAAAGHRLRRGGLRGAVPHPEPDWGTRRGCRWHLRADARTRRGGGSLGARTRCRRTDRSRIDHRPGARPGRAGDLDLRPERCPRRSGRGTRGCAARRPRTARRGVREAARAQRRRGVPHARTRRGGRADARLPRESGLRAEPDARQGDYLATRRALQRPPLPRPRVRRACGTTHAVVLVRRASGGRRAERHAVSLVRGCAVPAHGAGPAALERRGGRCERADRFTEAAALQKEFGVDYGQSPAEDFAHAIVKLNAGGQPAPWSKRPRPGTSSARACGCAWSCWAPSTRCRSTR